MTNITDELQQAIEGLLFLSESDAPFEVFCWKSDGRLTPAKLLQLTSHPASTPVQVVSIDEFFAPAVTEEDWHDAEEQETVHRFQQLVNVLKHNLSNIQVYRVGKRSIDAYIVGSISDSDWAGVATKLVET